MPSGKQSKRLRREAAPPPVRGASRRRQASPRVLALAAVLLLAVVAAVVLGLVFAGRNDSTATQLPATGSLTNAVGGAAEVQELLQGIPQSGDVLGEPSAPVTVVEYIDAQCPYCRQFELDAMPALIERYVRSGKAKIELRALAFLGPDSERGRAAIIAAGEQDKLFNVAQLLFHQQGVENSGWLSDDLRGRVAASIPGLDVQRFLGDLDSATVSSESAAFDAAARSAGVASTPTILVGTSAETAQQVPLASPSDGDAVARAIDAVEP